MCLPLVDAKDPVAAGDDPRDEERTEADSTASSVMPPPAVLCDRLLCDLLAEPIDRDDTDRRRSIWSGNSPTSSRRLERRSKLRVDLSPLSPLRSPAGLKTAPNVTIS